MGAFSKTRWLKITIKIILRESSFAKNKIKISNVCFDQKLVFRCLILEIIFVEAFVDFFSHGEFVCFEFQERSKSKPNWSGKFKAKI